VVLIENGQTRRKVDFFCLATLIAYATSRSSSIYFKICDRTHNVISKGGQTTILVRWSAGPLPSVLLKC
jgi:hypothetical protein